VEINSDKKLSGFFKALSFNPHEIAFLDTATIFIPQKELLTFPFDMLFISNIYQWTYAIGFRAGAMSHSFRSGVQPTTFRLLPWTYNLVHYSDTIGEKRYDFLNICKAIYSRPESLLVALFDLGNITLQDACRHVNSPIDWSENLDGNQSIIIIAPKATQQPVKHGNGWRIQLGETLQDFITIGDESIAKRVSATLTIYNETKLKKGEILRLPIPSDDTSLNKFIQAVYDYDNGSHADKLEMLIDEIDHIVGKAFGLTTQDIDFIQSEMKNDTFLKRIKPNLPFTGKKKRGLLEALSTSSRYSSEA